MILFCYNILQKKTKGKTMIRNAIMNDSDAIFSLINRQAKKGLMLPKTPSEIYKNIPNFLVYEENRKILGCCRLSIAWSDLAEVASLAVAENETNKGIGTALVNGIIQKAKDLKLSILFSLSHQVNFFKKSGFSEVERSTLPYKTFNDCLNCPKLNNCDKHAFILKL